jgi:glycosyltransferase involved in cell wall biosynthesis
VLDGQGMRFSREGYLERVRRCYAVVLPSVSDVNPNGIIDAIRYGKPFLCTKDSGIYDRLKEVGVFVDTLDADSMAHGLETLLDDEKYAALQAKIAAFTFTHSWAEITDELLSIAQRP